MNSCCRSSPPNRSRRGQKGSGQLIGFLERASDSRPNATPLQNAKGKVLNWRDEVLNWRDKALNSRGKVLNSRQKSIGQMPVNGEACVSADFPHSGPLDDLRPVFGRLIGYWTTCAGESGVATKDSVSTSQASAKVCDARDSPPC